jgi:hypothetical protein
MWQRKIRPPTPARSTGERLAHRTDNAMFPNHVFLAVTTSLALMVAGSLPFSGWRGLIKNALMALAVTYLAIAGAVVMGMVFHVAIFGEPVMID